MVGTFGCGAERQSMGRWGLDAHAWTIVFGGELSAGLQEGAFHPMASDQKKRGQHYVWRKYLEAWEVDGKLWALRDGKVFSSAAKGIAKERDFYALVELTQEERAFVRSVAIERTGDARLREDNEGWLETLQLPFRLRDAMIQLGLPPSAAQQAMDTAINNTEEDLHGAIETGAVHALAALRAGDPSFYKHEKPRASFAHYVCLQFLRTKRNQQRFVESFREHYGQRFRLEACWSVIRHVLATNMAWRLFAEHDRYRLTVVRNRTGVPLITGDQPVLNTFVIGKPAIEEESDTELYYPVDAATAVFLGARDRSSRDLSEQDVRFYNNAIREASLEQIFASQKETLLAP
jgi:hypothetical protein